MRVGFVGLGHMGEPMARNLVRAGVPLWVWNRRIERCERLHAEGAVRTLSVDALFAQTDTVLMMLRGEAAIEAVLGRGTPAFAQRVRGRCIVQLGTVPAAWSARLAQDIRAQGGEYIEAPVSGSRIPAERAQLVGMVAGDPLAVERVMPLLRVMCREVIPCGDVPQALRLKLAVNHYLITTVAALAETVHSAAQLGVDPALLQRVLDAGPMASEVSRGKLAKMHNADFNAQAGVADVTQIAEWVLAQAEHANAHAPILQATLQLFQNARDNGHANADMAAVLHAFALPAMQASAQAPERIPEQISAQDSEQVPAQAPAQPSASPAAPVACVAADIALRHVASRYPAPFAARMQGREKRALAEVFGIKNFGVNLTRLAPGAQTALRHAHSHQDEFVYVLEGELCLRSDAGETILVAGMCAGFPAGSGNAHHFINRSDREAVVLEMGDRSGGDVVIYPDDDLHAELRDGIWQFLHKNGERW